MGCDAGVGAVWGCGVDGGAMDGSEEEEGWCLLNTDAADGTS